MGKSIVAAERITVVMFLCYDRRGWISSTVSWAFPGNSGHTQVIVVVRVNPGWEGSVKTLNTDTPKACWPNVCLTRRCLTRPAMWTVLEPKPTTE